MTVKSTKIFVLFLYISVLLLHFICDLLKEKIYKKKKKERKDNTSTIHAAGHLFGCF